MRCKVKSFREVSPIEVEKGVNGPAPGNGAGRVMQGKQIPA